MSFDAFPFFRRASVDDILRVELHGEDHLHWPALDVDLEIDSIRHPEHFPLVDRKPAAGRSLPLRRN